MAYFSTDRLGKTNQEGKGGTRKNMETRNKKHSLVKRAAALLMALLMAFGTFITKPATTAKAAELPAGAKKAIQLKAPAKDGVYYAKVNLMNANSSGQYSMGNASLRGSDSYLQKQPTDTQYRQIVIVKDGKATALVEFMPMGFLGTYGFMMELESVTPTAYSKYGAPLEEATTYTPAEVLSKHFTTGGNIVYDAYNDPESSQVFNGTDPTKHTRPAGYGKEERLVNIENQPYNHLLALDVTPMTIEGGKEPENAEDYDVTTAAWTHVFVPVMFSISPSSGDQYARMMVDWTSLEPVEDVENNVQYQLYEAMQIEKGNYTEDSYQNLQTVIANTQTTLSNIWQGTHLEMNGSGFSAQPKLSCNELSAEAQKALCTDIKNAVNALEEKGDKTSLKALIQEAESLSEENYTPNSFSKFKEALENAKKVEADEEATVSAVSEAVSELTDAKNALILRADTSSLSALVAEMKAKTNDGYTQKSWQYFCEALEKAEQILQDANASQTDVNICESVLREAAEGLEKETALDKNNLPDGVYSIEAQMIKMNRNEYSMSNNAINHTLKLEVINGTYYATLDFQGITIENRFGYLSGLFYYAEGYQYGQYGDIQGELVPAEVLTTQKDADGNDVIDQYNDAQNLYPDLVRVQIVPTAIADAEGYVPLHVFVPIMESIAAGNGDQNVLMKLDWNTLKATNENDPSFQPETPVVQSPAVNVTHEQTGIKVEAEKGVLPEGAALKLEAITTGDAYNNAANILADVGKKLRLYDIHFEVNGAEIQPNGVVTLKFPIPEGYDAQNLVMYRINDDGTKTLIKGGVEDGYYKIATKHFSYYALVEKGSTITDAENTAQIEANKNTPVVGSGANNVNGQTANVSAGNNTKVTSPKTGENIAIEYVEAIALLAAMILILAAAKKWKKTLLIKSHQ